MSAHFAIYHHSGSPPYYDIIIDRDNDISIFRLANYVMLDFLDGNELKAVEIDPGSIDRAVLDIAAGRKKGDAGLYDSGTCSIERWNPPVYIIQIAARRFIGTLHILKVEEGYSLRYVRSRRLKPSPR